jgi:hypothetical protein
MNSFIKIKTIILVLLFAACIVHAQSDKKLSLPPTLISPQNNSTLQPTKNLELRWSDMGYATIFRAQYSTDSVFSTNGIIGELVVSGPSIVISKLNNSSTYYWRVRLESDINSWSSVWKFNTTALPIAPVIFSPLNNLINIDIPVTFKWSKNIINKGYILQYADNSSFVSPGNYTTVDSFVVIKDISSNKQYYWRVKSYNIDFDNSDWSNTMSFYTKLEAPKLLSPLNNQINLDTAITLKWSAVDSAETYRIEVGYDSLFSIGPFFYTKDTPALSAKINNLPYCTDFYWRILAFNSSGKISRLSDVSRFRTGFNVPQLDQPSDSLINADTALTFSGKALKNTYNYRLQISQDSLFISIVADTISFSAAIKVNRLNYMTKYFWRMKANDNISDTSAWSAKRFFITQIQRPQLIEPGNDSLLSSSRIDFKWQKADSAGFYKLQIGFDSTFSNVAIDTTIKNSFITLTSLVSDAAYFWRARSIQKDSVTASKWSDVFRFKTKPSVVLTPQIIKDTINLSDNYTDTLSSIIITNYGTKQFEINKIIISPDTLFYTPNAAGIIPSGGNNIFTIKFHPDKVKSGLNNGYVSFVRKNYSTMKDDTLSVAVSLYIQKASASFVSDGLVFGNCYANNTYVKNFNISNSDGNADLKIRRIAITGADDSSFVVLDTIKIIPAGGSKDVRISFKPYRTGKYAAQLNIVSNSFNDTLSEFIVGGYGYGGLLDAQSQQSINNLSASPFESFFTTDKKAQIKNSGNSVLNLDFSFKNNYFTIANDVKKSFVLYSGDSIGAIVRYSLPNFKSFNIDTMVIVSNGFTADTQLVVLRGEFDSLKVKNYVLSNIKINGGAFLNANKVFPESTAVVFSLSPLTFNSLSNIGFKLKYYTGGMTNYKTVYNDGNYNYIIPATDVTNKGLIFSGEIYTNNTSGNTVDSLETFGLTDGQVLLTNYSTPAITIPLSKPGATADKADVNWVFFGFPFDNTAVDSAFGYFGGRSKMKDGEWVLYQYDPNADGYFSLFSDYYFGLNKGYFTAQSLKDTFALSYTYYGNIRTKKLSDTVITFTGSNWKTISSPFTFEVGIDPSVPLREYNTYKKAYTMTSSMQPGKAYFVEPSVQYLKMIPYGSYTYSDLPKIVADIGWYVKIQAACSNREKEVLLSVDTQNKSIAKTLSAQLDFSAAPQIEKDFNLTIRNDNSSIKNCVSVQKEKDGAVWNISLDGSQHQETIKLNVSKLGTLPAGFGAALFDNATGKAVVDTVYICTLNKLEEKTFKVIIGSKEFINKKITEFSNTVIYNFSLSQNYPNPFNPSTIIKYSVPVLQNANLQKVELKVYNMLGQAVATLVNEFKSAGEYQVEFNGASLASGVYFYRLKAGSRVESKKMILLK